MNKYTLPLILLALLFSDIFSQVGTYQLVVKDRAPDIKISKIDSNGFFFKIECLNCSDEPILLVDFVENIFKAKLKGNNFFKIFSTSADTVELENSINSLWSKAIIKREEDKLKTIKSANAAIIAKLASQDSIGYVIVKMGIFKSDA